MLDISIKPLLKVVNKPAKALGFIKKHIVAVEKIDGTKLTLIRNNLPFDPRDYSKNWIVAYKGNVIYHSEFFGLEGRDSDIKKSAIGASQYKFVHDHLRKIHPRSASIPCDTEFFVEFVQNKPTITRDYHVKHGLFLVGFGPSQYAQSRGFVFSASKFSNDLKLLEEYRKILQLKPFPVVFDGTLGSKSSILKGCIDQSLKSIFKKNINDVDFSDSMSIIDFANSAFSQLESSLGGPAEGVVIRVEDNENLIKVLSADQHDKAVRDAKKARYKGTSEQEDAYWKEVNRLIDDLLNGADFTNTIEFLGGLSRTVYSTANVPDHPVKSKINVQEDVFLTAKLRILGTGSQGSSSVAVIPMAAKPFHAGHDSLVRQAANDGNDSVVVLISTRGREEIKAEDMIPLWRDHYIPGLLRQYSEKIVIRFSESPMRDATLIARDFANRRKSAVVRIYGGIDSMGQSDAQQRVAAVLQKNPELSDRIIATDVSRSQTNNVSGTEMRHYASSGDAKSFMKNLPGWLSNKEKSKIWQQFQE
jgi:hypothetical protein